MLPVNRQVWKNVINNVEKGHLCQWDSYIKLFVPDWGKKIISFHPNFGVSLDIKSVVNDIVWPMCWVTPCHKFSQAQISYVICLRTNNYFKRSTLFLTTYTLYCRSPLKIVSRERVFTPYLLKKIWLWVRHIEFD